MKGLVFKSVVHLTAFFLSKIFGFARTIVLLRKFGVSQSYDKFWMFFNVLSLGLHLISSSLEGSFMFLGKSRKNLGFKLLLLSEFIFMGYATLTAVTLVFFTGYMTFWKLLLILYFLVEIAMVHLEVQISYSGYYWLINVLRLVFSISMFLVAFFGKSGVVTLVYMFLLPAIVTLFVEYAFYMFKIAPIVESFPKVTFDRAFKIFVLNIKGVILKVSANKIYALVDYFFMMMYHVSVTIGQYTNLMLGGIFSAIKSLFMRASIEFSKKGKEYYLGMYRKFTDLVFYVAGPVSVIIYLFSADIVRVVANWMPASINLISFSEALRVSVIQRLVVGMQWIYLVRYFQLVGRPQAYWELSWMSIIANVIADYLLVKDYGIVGVYFGTSVVGFVVVSYILVKEGFDISVLFFNILKTFTLNGVLFLPLKFMGIRGISLLAIVAFITPIAYVLFEQFYELPANFRISRIFKKKN